jgi:uncharacterized delta-60 repeat protein
MQSDIHHSTNNGAKDISHPQREHVFHRKNFMNCVAFLKRLSLPVCAAAFALPTLLMAGAGSLDSTFGTNGIVTTANTGANAAALQNDGKIVVAGSISTSQNPHQPGIMRYNIDGTPDRNFGSGGRVIVPATVEVGPAFAVAIQSDGKILAATPNNLRVGVFRFNANGTPDRTFGSNGVATIRPSVLDEGSFLVGGIVVQSDGKILVAANDEGTAAQTFGRLLPNGQPDSTFGTNGVAPLVTGAQTLALQPGGQILVLSFFGGGGTAVRYTTNGSLDTTFSGVGQAPGFGSGSPGGLAVINSTSKFIVTGSLIKSLTFKDSVSGFLLVRYMSDGVIDSSFGRNGIAVTPFPGNMSSSALSVAIQANGDIVAAGETATTASGPSDFALARYTANGTLDTTFGNGGFVSTPFGNSIASVNTVLIQTDGKILALGNSDNGTTLARYLAQ